MAIDKILQKIKIQIGEMSDSMESFVDETIQPSVTDCDGLRKQLNDLLENLAVYKYHKLNNELSPSFNIHAKVSEMSPVSERQEERSEPPAEYFSNVSTPDPEKKQAPSSKPKHPLTIGINDKFRFINELFAQNNSEYNIVLEQLSTLQSWPDTELYLNSLKNVYGWEEKNEVVKYFYGLAKKRFE